LVTELVAGASLKDLLKRAAQRRARSARERDAVRLIGAEAPAAPSSVRACVDLAHQVADALAHAHERGVVHRDVKPSNIMVTPDGRARLIDFGIALATDGGERITRTGVFLGSHEYAAPEQLCGDKHEIGPWTDCYALGATLFELLTLKTPFDGMGLGPRIARADAKPDATARDLNRGVDRSLDGVVMRALHPARRKRFGDGAELAAALSGWLARRAE
jgi:serine/threonine-protein kinase